LFVNVNTTANDPPSANTPSRRSQGHIRVRRGRGETSVAATGGFMAAAILTPSVRTCAQSATEIGPRHATAVR
jgi:hypothetical protein